MSWLLSVGLRALIIFAVWNGLVLAFEPHPDLTLLDLDANSDARIRAEQFIYGPPREAVMTGSSLCRALYLEQPRNIFNLCVSGGNPLTGLEVILRSGRQPRVVFIETNVIERPLNDALVDAIFAPPLYQMRQFLPALRKEYLPAMLPIGYVGHPLPRSWSDIVEMSTIAMNRIASALMPAHNRWQIDPATKLLAGSSYPMTSNIDEADVPSMLNIVPTRLKESQDVTARFKAAVHSGVEKLYEQVTRLQRHGTCVLLMRLPIQPVLDAAPTERYIDAALRARFLADHYVWLDFGDPRNYHTVDGYHQTSRTAKLSVAVIGNRAAAAVANSSDRCWPKG